MSHWPKFIIYSVLVLLAALVPLTFASPESRVALAVIVILFVEGVLLVKQGLESLDKWVFFVVDAALLWLAYKGLADANFVPVVALAIAIALIYAVQNRGNLTQMLVYTVPVIVAALVAYFLNAGALTALVLAVGLIVAWLIRLLEDLNQAQPTAKAA